jgi:hypothetical protein
MEDMVVLLIAPAGDGDIQQPQSTMDALGDGVVTGGIAGADLAAGDGKEGAGDADGDDGGW